MIPDAETEATGGATRRADGEGNPHPPAPTFKPSTVTWREARESIEFERGRLAFRAGKGGGK